MCSATSAAKSNAPAPVASRTRRWARSRTCRATASSARGVKERHITDRMARWRGPSVTASIFPPAESSPASRTSSTVPRADLNASASL
ncbi:hypothetical protein HEP87_62040 [Streptomyces sp. S1D4-11]